MALQLNSYRCAAPEKNKHSGVDRSSWILYPTIINCRDKRAAQATLLTSFYDQVPSEGKVIALYMHQSNQEGVSRLSSLEFQSCCLITVGRSISEFHIGGLPMCVFFSWAAYRYEFSCKECFKLLMIIEATYSNDLRSSFIRHPWEFLIYSCISG